MAADAVYASVDAVVAPTAVAPGGRFVVNVMATRRGRRVAVEKELFKASGCAPTIVMPKRTLAGGARSAQRPSALARAEAGSVRARAIDHVVTNNVDITEWATTTVLPFEVHADDVGWFPGPVNGSAGRPMPPFTGHQRGVRDASLTAQSSARRIMQSVQFTRHFKQKAVELARGHEEYWQATHNRRDGIERAFTASELRESHVELWYAATAKAAALNPAVPADSLYNKKSELYSPNLVAALPHDKLRWLNRHLSFGGVGATAADGDCEAAGGVDGASGAPKDPYRKRREVSDIARAAAPRVWWPGQHLGFDDLVRVTRHREGRRVRDKAAVHTGRRGDGLNDAHSHYFLHWEEHGWQRSNSVTGAVNGADACEHQHPRAEGRDGGADGAAAAPSGGASASASRGRGTGGSGGSGGRGRGRGRGRAGSRGRAGRGRAGRRAQRPEEPGEAHRGDRPAEQAGSDESDAEADEEGGDGPNSVKARLLRALRVVEPNVGHCVWLDRGQGSVSGMQAAREAGFHATAMMASNRIGLPRRYIAQLKKEMKCPRGCTHASTCVGCKRWSWTCLHKGEWELQLWSDGAELVVCLTSCASGTRTITVSRTVGSEVNLVECPEGTGFYTTVGRGPTDGGDQRRKQLSLAVRRRLRQGPKGALFDAELGFVDGSIVASELRDTIVTVWDFVTEFADNVIGAVTMRKLSSAALAHAVCAAPLTRAQERAHVPVWPAGERRKRGRASDELLPAAKRGTRCCCKGECDAGEPERPQFWCPGCEADYGNGWYHWACYWRHHHAVDTG